MRVARGNAVRISRDDRASGATRRIDHRCGRWLSGKQRLGEDDARGVLTHVVLHDLRVEVRRRAGIRHETVPVVFVPQLRIEKPTIARTPLIAERSKEELRLNGVIRAARVSVPQRHPVGTGCRGVRAECTAVVRTGVCVRAPQLERTSAGDARDSGIVLLGSRPFVPARERAAALTHNADW